MFKVNQTKKQHRVPLHAHFPGILNGRGTFSPLKHLYISRIHIVLVTTRVTAFKGDGSGEHVCIVAICRAI